MPEVSEKKAIPPVVWALLAGVLYIIIRYASILIGRDEFADQAYLQFLNPMAEFIRSQGIEGKIPLWNPDLNQGGPVLPGLLPSVFYPPLYIFLLKPSASACSVFLILHEIVVFLGAFLVSSSGLRSLPGPARRPALIPYLALVIAAVYLIAVILLCQDVNLSLLAGLTWLPLLKWSIWRSTGCGVTRQYPPHPGSILVMNSLFLALVILSGSAWVIAISVLYVIVLPCFSKEIGKICFLTGISAVLAFCLAAPSIFQSAEALTFDLSGQRQFELSRLKDCFILEFPARFPAINKHIPIAYSSEGFAWVDEPSSLAGRSSQKQDNASNVLLLSRTVREEPDKERMENLPLAQFNPPEGPPIERKTPFDPGTGKKPVLIMRYESQHVAMSIKSDHAAFVVLNDPFYPGWKSYVDSYPVPNFLCEGQGRAVYVSAGDHLLAFDYHPEWLNPCMNIMITALVVEVLLTFYWLWRLLGKTVRLLAYGTFE